MYHLLQEAADKQSLGDILAAAATGVVTAATTTKNPSKYSYSSMAKAASQLIAVFPVLASKSVSSESVHMVSKYIEQRACQMFMIALQAANIDTAENGIEYLRHYHQNLDIGGDTVQAVVDLMKDWTDAYKKGYNESSISLSEYRSLDENAFDYLLENDIDLEISAKDLNSLMELMKTNEALEFYDTKLNPISINDYMVTEMAGDYRVSIKRYDTLNEAKRPSTSGLRDEFKYGDDSWKYYDTDNPIPPGDPRYDDCDVYAADGNGYMFKKGGRERALRDQSDADANRAREDQNTQNRYREQDRAQAKHDRNRAQQEKEKEAKYRAREEQRQAEYERLNKVRNTAKTVSILKDQDIKKMNDAVPSILLVKFYNSSNASVATEFIIGVKSKILPVDSTEILRRIMNDNKDGKKFLKLMRVITGELKASDVIFGLARIKDDLASTKKKGAHGDTWELLKNRAELAKMQVARGQRNDFSAITTVLISQADADELYREENFDITNPRNAKHFMESYNLMAFAIADDSIESLKILLDDGSNDWDEYAYRMLDRETQTEYKKLVNLMANSR